MQNDPDNAKSIFMAAIEKYSPDQWSAFLDSACGSDVTLRRRVDELLQAHVDMGSIHVPALEPTMERSLTEQPGTQIGPYKLLQQIGEGGMGIVYLAEQKEPVKRRVALKIVKPGMDTRQVIARFEAERQALAMMDHPNIAKVLEAGATDSGKPYFVMELVDGLPITTYCDEQHLTPKERLELFIPVCQAVQHAHQKGIIHRDLKPSNILVALYDARRVPKVIDFGVAKATQQTLTERTLFTQLGQIVGTLEYMSPEQAQRNQLDIDTRSDVYSLGVLLYELLTGDTPFDRQRLRSAAFEEMLRIIRQEEPPKPSTKVSSSRSLAAIAANRQIEPRKLGALIRGELDWIVMKALEKDRGRRYDSAAALAEDIRRHLEHQPVSASPPSALYRVRKFVGGHRVGVTTAAIILLLVLVGLAGTVVQLRRALRAEKRAQQLLESERVAREHATAQAREARTQTRALETILRFLTDDVLAQADPNQDANRDLTLREILDRASRNIDGRFADQPVVEARIHQTLGLTYVNLSQLPTAMAHLSRALELCQEHRGPQDDLTIAALNNLAAVYEYQGQYELAEPLFRQAWIAMKAKHGEKHEDTLTCLNNLAWSMKMQSRLEEALPHFQQVLEMRRETLGQSAPDTLVSLNDLASVYYAQQRFEEAEPLFAEAASKLEQVNGLESPDTLRGMHNLASLYRAQGRFSEAQQLFDKVLQVRRKVQGENHAATLATLHNLAWTYQGMNRVQEAESHYVDVIQRRRQHLRSGHPDLYASLNNLAALYLKNNRPQDAEPVLRECVEIQDRNQVQTWHRYRTLSRLGECLMLRAREHAIEEQGVGLRNEAETLLLDAFDRLGQSAEETAERLLTARRLAALYESWGKTDEFSKWQSMMQQLREADDAQVNGVKTKTGR